VDDWNAPASSLYSRPEPTGLLTVTIALPEPWEQSTEVTGIAGDGGCALIVTPFDDTDVQPDALVTIKVNVPAESPVTVVLLPVPLVVTEPGVLNNVQAPAEGNPLRTTLPVASVHVG
jgi:hypothetical protein